MGKSGGFCRVPAGSVRANPTGPTVENMALSRRLRLTNGIRDSHSERALCIEDKKNWHLN